MATAAPSTLNVREYLPKGLTFTRLAIASALGGDDCERAANIARLRWGDDSPVHRILKAGDLDNTIQMGMVEKAEIPAGASVSGNWARLLVSFESASTDFFGLVRDRSLIGRLPGLRRVPLQTRMVSAATGFSAAWVGAGEAKPVGKATFAEANLPLRKVTSLCVLTEEHLTRADAAAELLIRDDMAAAMIEVIDDSFINPTNSGTTDVEPASVTYGAATEAATGTTTDDIRDAAAFLVRNFAGDLTQAYFVGRPELLAHLGLNAAFTAEPIGARGGSLGGIPAVASKALPLDAGGKQQLVLIDPTGIAYGEEGMMLRTSRQASIEMVDEPTGNAGAVDPPVAASLVSLWQCNSIGLLSEKFLNWHVARAGSVRVITGLEGGLAS